MGDFPLLAGGALVHAFLRQSLLILGLLWPLLYFVCIPYI